MKKQGRPAEPLSQERLSAVNEYLNSDKSYQEVADKYSVSVNNLKYWTAKFRKELENGRTTEDNRG